MIDLFIVGAGGWGREVLNQLRGDAAHEKDWRVAGFLDSRPDALAGFDVGLLIVGDPLTHQPQPNQEFICALGDPARRRHYAAALLARGARFMNIRGESHLPPALSMGQGNFFTRMLQISPDARIGSFCNINTLSVISHDVVLGDYVQIGAMVFIGGGARIGSMVTVHPHATILPGITIGDGAIIGAGSVVVKNVPADTTVFGNPARAIFQASTPATGA
ncbi:acetyltransferase [Xylophilus sp. Kf1]|nr:acetyltransferase [Xylophilus sp. Kf1]